MDKFNLVKDFYCQKVLPLVYDDSLSYYEVLCKLQKIINDVINNQNIIIDYFIKFKEYVDGKLEEYAKDQMNEWLNDGTIDNIINVKKFEELKAEINEKLLTMQNEINVIAEDVNKSLIKDVLNFSTFQKDNLDVNDRFEKAVLYTSQNNLKLYIDENIKLTRTVTLYSNAYIFSNRNKYKIYTETGTSLNGINLIDCYNLKNVVVHNVKFENTGYGQSGANGIPGRFDGFGSALNFGNCSNVEVYECEFYKCGGYNFGEGSAMLWFSCCHYCKAHDNYLHLGDNGIVVDRWWATAPSNSTGYNFGIELYNNLIEHISGRGIGIENINDKGNIIISNNIVSDYGIAGVEGRGFQDVIITDNIFNGDLAVRINPKDYYGLTQAGWDWASKIIKMPAYGVQMISSGDRQIISNNIISFVSSQGITLGAYKNTLIANNKISHATNHGIYGKCIEDTEMFSVVGNQIVDVGAGVRLSRDKTFKNKNIIINDNFIECTSEAISIENGDKLVSTGNILTVIEGTYGVYLQNCVDVLLDNLLKTKTIETKVNIGYNIIGADNVVVNGIIDGFSNLLSLRNSSNVSGSATLKNGVNAISIDSTVTGDGRNFKFQGITGSYKSQGNTFPIVLYVDKLPTVGNGYYSTQDIVYYNVPSEKGYIGAVCVTAGNGGVWKNFGAIAS